MKKMLKLHFVFIFALLFFTACASQNTLSVKATGDTAEIVMMRNNAKFIVELLAVQDNSLLFNHSTSNEKIVSANLDDLQRITIKGYTNRKWIIPLVLFEVVPAVLLGVAASQAGVDNPGGVFLISLIPAMINYFVFEISTPNQPKFNNPFSTSDLRTLKKYARFPQGLTPDQLDQLLRINNQTRIRQLK